MRRFLVLDHKDKTFLLGDELIQVNRGSFVTSKEKLQNKFKWGRKKLDTFFKLLKQEQMLDTQGIGKGTHKGTQLFVLNYSKYQDKEHTKEHSTDTERNTKGYSRGTTTKECIKNVKKEEIYSDDKSSEINSNTKRFKEPTEDEVREYFKLKGNEAEADVFYNFYASKGWMVGKNKMKEWKRAVTGWISRNKPAAKTEKDQDKEEYLKLGSSRYAIKYGNEKTALMCDKYGLQ